MFTFLRNASYFIGIFPAEAGSHFTSAVGTSNPDVNKRLTSGKMASHLLPHLDTKLDIDNVIRHTEELVLVLRFGRDEDPVCMQLDHIVSSKNIVMSYVFAMLTMKMNAVFSSIAFGSFGHFDTQTFYKEYVCKDLGH